MDNISSRTIPRELGSPVLELPIEKEGPDDFFPAVCLKNHWDPTMILRHTLPDGYVPQTTDPRPWTRICMEYTTAGEQSEAPTINSSIVMPSGGQFYPASKYAASIDDESKLRMLDRRLGVCEAEQYEPNQNGDMYNPRLLVPERKTAPNSSVIEELAYPKALLRSGPYECRGENDTLNLANSSDFLFNNATKQDRYKAMNKPNRPAPPVNKIKASLEKMRPDLLLNAGGPRPTPALGVATIGSGNVFNISSNPSAVDTNPNRSYEAAAANQRAGLVLNANDAGSHRVGVPRVTTHADRQQELSDFAQSAGYSQESGPMVTSWFSDNSPFAAFSSR